MSAPQTRCPAIHVADPALAPAEELAPLIAFLGGEPGVPRGQRFPRGSALRDGRLDLCKQGVGDDGLRAVLGALSKGHPWLRHLLLGTNALGDAGAQQIADALARGLDVHTLYLGCNGLSSSGVAALARGVSSSTAVRALWLKRNPIGEGGLRALLEALPASRLRTLDLTNCELGDEGVASLCAALLEAPAQIEHLFVGGNGLSNAGPLAALLAHPNCGLHTLFVGASRLGDEGLRALAPSLAKNTSLRSLDLGSNDLSAAGLEALAAHADALSLRWLSLGDSPASLALGERPNALSADALASLVALGNSSIEELGLLGAGVDSRLARALIEALEGAPLPPRLRFGKGVAKRLRRRGGTLSNRPSRSPSDVRHIKSVYR